MSERILERCGTRLADASTQIGTTPASAIEPNQTFPKTHARMSLTSFSFPTRTLFGAGSLRELPAHLARLGIHRPLVVTDPGLARTDAFKSLEAVLGAAGRGSTWFVFDGVHPNPIEDDVRIPGAISREKLDILRKADVIYLDEIRTAGLYNEIWQAFAVLLPVRTVGVMGDGRTYDRVLGLRAVTSTDGMTAESYPFDHAFLARVCTRIARLRIVSAGGQQKQEAPFPTRLHRAKRWFLRNVPGH
jgi:hypothetical protein